MRPGAITTSQRQSGIACVVTSPKKFRAVKSAGKVLLAVFFDGQGALLGEFSLSSSTEKALTPMCTVRHSDAYAVFRSHTNGTGQVQMGDVGPSTLQSGHVALRFPCVLSTEETPEREALQLGRRTQGHCERLGLVTATGILGTRNPTACSSVGPLCSGLCDEAHFWLNGYVNKQNCRIWSEANPQVYVETPLHPEKLTVWCALWAGGIIGPYFFKNDEGHNVTVNGDRYRAMITNFFIPELNNHDVLELWFQQDGATCHTARATIDLLKDTFGDRLILRFGPVNWPPRSCDLTPLDYFLWGYVNIAVRIRRDPMTVSRIWNRWFQDGNTEYRAGSQRPPIASSREDRHVTRMALMDREATSRALSQELGSFARQQMSA
ncbi:transposable element Tc3 transposase [Trichonephila clavipes]|nr:transposable element Tc3 transposase [Trichonephila clavipes]